MSKIEDNHRHHPYYRTKKFYNDRRYNEDNYRSQYKKDRKYQYSTTSHRDNKHYNDFSYRRSYRNDNHNHHSHHHHHHHHQQQIKSKSKSYFSSPPAPLLKSSSDPSTNENQSISSNSVVPHERESWIRSVKKTKNNESTEQKTQYLETMLRLPQQQKSLFDSSKFDQIRFADNQLSTKTTMTNNNEDLINSSFHLVNDVDNHGDICIIEKLLFNNEIQQASNAQSSNSDQPCSGFLIDNCDEEILPPVSSPARASLPVISSSDEFVEQNNDDTNQRSFMLVCELDAADAEHKKELKYQKRLYKKLKKKSKQTNRQETNVNINTNDKPELSSDWISEYDNNEINQVSKIADELRETSSTITNEDKTAKVNMILMKIKEQQNELRKLRRYVISMLDECDKPVSSKSNRQNSNIAHDLLLAFLNQPVKSGCWLCSGKMYAETGTQCDHIDD